MFHDKSYLPYFVPAGILLLNDVHHFSSLPDNDRAMCLLKNISAPLECGETQSFYKMLEIMYVHGNLHAQQLAESINKFVEVKPVVGSESTENVSLEGTCMSRIHFV